MQKSDIGTMMFKRWAGVADALEHKTNILVEKQIMNVFTFFKF